jgi:uncharacterized protein
MKAITSTVTSLAEQATRQTSLAEQATRQTSLYRIFCQGSSSLAALFLLMFTASSFAAGKSTYKDVEWLELMPKDEVIALEKSQGLPVNHDAKGEQLGSFRTVDGINNQKIRLAGYVVPVEQSDDGKTTEFFFVPYFGACIHVPPPPPNNIVYVKMSRPVESVDMFSAYWIEGTIRTERLTNDIAATAYVMSGDALKLYE